MSTKNDRMKEISFWAIPPKGTKEYEDTIARINKRKDDPELKKLFKKTHKRAVSLIDIQQVNGIGFPADNMLREYNLEYNRRVLSGSLYDLPSSFNVGEAFNEFLPPTATFKLRNEIDHFFSFNSFIDYITSSEFDNSKDPNFDEFKEGVIYSFNSTSFPEDFTFSSDDGKSFGLSSISMIKLGCEISMIMVAGQLCDLEAKTKEIVEIIKKQKTFSHRSHIRPSSDFEAKATPLYDGSNLLKSIILTRIDIETKTIDARYVYEDWGQSYHGKTDDISAFLDNSGKFINDDAEKFFKNMPTVLNEYQALFELSKTCLFLPEYFLHFQDDITVERHPTKYLAFSKKVKNRKTIELVDSSEKKTYKEVYALNPVIKNYPSKVEFLTPDIKVQDSGFWKQLSPNVQGKDKNGNTITGRTWVKKILSWVEYPLDEGSLTINRKSIEIKSENSGYIYVMRCAAHNKDMFKVGLTTRDSEIRSNELTRSTSSPDAFLVVQEWHVRDCILAEKLIHKKLDKYRVNPKREFFKAKYNVIFAAIDEVMQLVGELE